MKNIVAIFVLLFGPLAFAHVGSPDIYFDGDAGPYHLLVTVRPPAMIPGVAQVDLRSTQGDIQAIRVVPIYLTAKDKGLPPVPDTMKPVAGDPRSFTGSVWLMASGSWEVRVEVEGAQGSAVVGIPVAAFARRTLPMQKALGAFLFALMLFLAFGIVAIAGAAAREGQVDPGVSPSPQRMHLARIAMAVAGVIVFAMIYLGNTWWNSEASTLRHDMLYKAPPLNASLNGQKLNLKIGSSDWHERRKSSWSMKLVPDHGHLMHLFVLRVPAMDRFYHLHPEQTAEGDFVANLPSIDAGHYKMFADIVRESGFPDTMVSEMDLPQIAGESLNGDDSSFTTSAFAPPAAGATSQLADGSRMVWERDAAPQSAGKPGWFRFRVVDEKGAPVSDLEPYMGMAGHAVFVRSDQQVFAHIHPAGSVPMAALDVVQKDIGETSMSRSMAMPGEVSFPYGFPQAGDYRMFVQVKRRGGIETGVFDIHVTN